MKTQTEIKNLKEGKFVIIDGEPCRVTKISTSKPGKHGSAKVRLEAVGIIDEKKREVVKPASTTVEVPIIEKKKAQVISISGDSAQLMDLEDYSMFEASIPDDMKGNLTEGQEVMYWEVLGKRLLRSR